MNEDSRIPESIHRGKRKTKRYAYTLDANAAMWLAELSHITISLCAKVRCRQQTRDISEEDFEFFLSNYVHIPERLT